MKITVSRDLLRARRSDHGTSLRLDDAKRYVRSATKKIGRRVGLERSWTDQIVHALRGRTPSAARQGLALLGTGKLWLPVAVAAAVGIGLTYAVRRYRHAGEHEGEEMPREEASRPAEPAQARPKKRSRKQTPAAHG